LVNLFTLSKYFTRMVANYNVNIDQIKQNMITGESENSVSPGSPILSLFKKAPPHRAERGS